MAVAHYKFLKKCFDSDLPPDTGELSSWTVSASVSVSFLVSVLPYHRTSLFPRHQILEPSGIPEKSGDFCS